MVRFLRFIRPAWLRYLAICVALGGLLTVAFIASVYLGLWGAIPDSEELSNTRLEQASEVYSADSVLIGKYYLSDRQPIPFSTMPSHAVQALVAIEDERFYEHSGIDYPSLGRVLIKTILMQDSEAGGGSTLSQQLAKNLYPRSGGGTVRLVADKVREMIIARRLERTFGKEEILEKYLNTVSFGDNTFGLESAARRFFDVPAAGLHLEEAAVLIGMLKGTYRYNPRLFPERSVQRRNLILRAMQRNGYLSQPQADSLEALPLALRYQPYGHDTGLAPYFRETVRKQLQHWLQNRSETDTSYNLYTSGLKIYTTLHSKMQQMAEASLAEHMPRLQEAFEKAYGNSAPWLKRGFRQKYVRQSEPYRILSDQGWSENRIMDSLEVRRPVVLEDWKGSRREEVSAVDSLMHYARLLQTGSLSLDAKTGAVLTWIGGIDFEHFKFDHISQSRRQVGSTFKPILYTTALESGISPCEYFSAREVRYKNLEDWTPSNSGTRNEAYMNYSMQEALTHSVNTVAVKVLEQTGIPAVVKQARALGITAELPEKPSLALGTGSIGIPELAGAYASYLNGGRSATPYLIESVRDASDRLLFRHESVVRKPAYSETTRQIMLEMLQAVVARGTASRLRGQYGLEGALAGKTGTTQHNKDAWFVGLSPNLVHVSWVGLESYELGFPNTRIGQGANAALPLFALWYQKLRKDPELRRWTLGEFSQPDPKVERLMDCPPVKKDGFLKRLFTNPNKTKSRKFRDKSN